ncbi:MAG: KTSC domain-containing protein [Allomuricauda sp.]
MTSTLYIRFRNNKLYSYSPVAKEKWEEFKKAESIGKYFHANFKMNSELKIEKK